LLIEVAKGNNNTNYKIQDQKAFDILII